MIELKGIEKQLHELQPYMQSSEQHTIVRMSAVATRLRHALEEDAAGEKKRAEAALPAIAAEVKELAPKIVAMCASSVETNGTKQSKVPAAARELAAICVPAIARKEKSPPGVGPKVTALLEAFKQDTNREEDLNYMYVAEQNLRAGCGPQYVKAVEAAIGD